MLKLTATPSDEEMLKKVLIGLYPDAAKLISGIVAEPGSNITLADQIDGATKARINIQILPDGT